MTDTSAVGVVARSELIVKYDGPSVAGGRMDVRSLAPALLGLADAVQETGHTLYPLAPRVSLEITARQPGSFEVTLDLAQWGSAAGLAFSGDAATALANIKAILFDPAIGVVRFLRLRRRFPDAPTNDDGSISIEVDGATVRFPADVVRAGTKVEVKTGLAAVVDPMTDDPGVQACSVTFDPAVPPETLTEADAATFEPDPPSDEPDDDVTFTSNLRIVTQSWEPGLSWRFSEGAGGTRFPARITDPTFDAVLQQDEFRANDTMRCRVRRRQWDRGGGSISTLYEVVEVIKHTKATPQSVQLSITDEELNDGV